MRIVKEEITKTITKTKYIADDNTEFTKKSDCLNYEQELLEKEKNERLERQYVDLQIKSKEINISFFGKWYYVTSENKLLKLAKWLKESENIYMDIDKPKLINYPSWVSFHCNNDANWEILTLDSFIESIKCQFE
jgi:hypothetical protein